VDDIEEPVEDLLGRDVSQLHKDPLPYWSGEGWREELVHHRKKLAQRRGLSGPNCSGFGKNRGKKENADTQAAITNRHVPVIRPMCQAKYLPIYLYMKYNSLNKVSK